MSKKDLFEAKNISTLRLRIIMCALLIKTKNYSELFTYLELVPKWKWLTEPNCPTG